MRQTVTEVERYQDTSIIPKAVCHGRIRMRVVHGIFLGFHSSSEDRAIRLLLIAKKKSVGKNDTKKVKGERKEV